MPREKIRFRDLSGWLKTFIVLGWLYLIAIFLKENPDFFDRDTIIFILIIFIIYSFIKNFEEIKVWWKKQKTWEKILIIIGLITLVIMILSFF